MANKELLSRIHEQMANKRRMEKSLEQTLAYHRKHFPGIVKDVWHSPRKIKTFDFEEWKHMFDVFSTTPRSGP